MRLAEVAERNQIMLDIHHVSLNHGDLNDACSLRSSRTFARSTIET